MGLSEGKERKRISVRGQVDEKEIARRNWGKMTIAMEGR